MDLLKDLYKDEEVVEEVKKYFKVKEINQLIKSQAQLLVPNTNNNNSTIGSCFDIYFKFLFWDYLISTSNNAFEVGDWDVSEYLFRPINDRLLYASKQAKICTKETFKNLEEAINSDDSSKYENLANLSQTISYLKAWRHKGYIEIPKPQPEITVELIQLGSLFNSDNFSLSNQSKVFLNPSLSDYGSSFIPDIVFGYTVIDVKVKNLLEEKDIIQILCYYSIYQELASGSETQSENINIDSIGFYLARHGFYWKPNLTDYINKNELKSLVELLNYNIKHYKHYLY